MTETDASDIPTEPPAERPLIVPLERVLLRNDPSLETLFALIGSRRLADVIAWAFAGRSRLRAELAQAFPADPGHFIYDAAVLDLIREARAAGRPVVLVSDVDAVRAEAVANALGLFEVAVGPESAVALAEIEGDRLERPSGRSGLDIRVALRAMRVHQWVKNLLVFVPVVTALRFNAVSIGEAVLAFIAFGLCASGVYLLNDLIDLRADRAHPVKRNRPFAAGELAIPTGLLLALGLFVLAFLTAFVVAAEFAGVLALYLALTTAYSVLLKRKVMIDVVTLAALYAIRVIGGAVAIGVIVSDWLILFCIFAFLSLALVKRHAEMAMRLDEGLPDPANRDSRATDATLLLAMAVSAGFNAVVVFALYAQSEAVLELYRRPWVLRLACVPLIYWFARLVMVSQRRLLTEDPIVFAIKDRVSWASGALVAAAILAAI